MKTLFVSALALSVTALVACQSADVSQSADTRSIELGGTQARSTVEVPADNSSTSTNAPYALEGAPTAAPAVQTNFSYQAR